MNPVEDQVRAATRAQAQTLREVRPLRLTQAPQTVAWRGPGARARRARRFKTWIAPVAAAAAVIALAIALVIVRGIPNGRVATPRPPVAGAGVPPYYVAVTGPTGWYAYAPLSASASASPPSVLVIGETLTGKQLATIAPPRGSWYVGVTGAADDRTFVVSTMHMSSSGSPALAVTWYLLEIAPGGGYALAKLAIPDMRSWGVEAIGLSGSGRELAMSLVRAKREAGTPGFELRIYSVATGKLLRAWSTNDQSVLGDGVTVPGSQAHALFWADGDRAVVFPALVRVVGHGMKVISERQTERRIDVTAGSGDLIANSRLIWSLPAGAGDSRRCDPVGASVTADGKTVLCTTGPISSGTRAHGRVTLAWLAYSTAAPSVPRVLYKVTVDAPSSDASLADILWSDAAGSTLIVDWSVARSLSASTLHYGVVSQGRFRALPAVPALPGLWTIADW
jgi:hypothetical protein